MKKTDITYQEKLNELRLDLSHPNSVGINFIFVEGETDIRVYRKLFDLNKCKVENIPGGVNKLEECVNTFVTRYPLVIGIRDADFIRLKGVANNNKNIFLTDFHDMEMTMINHEPILNALLFEFSKIPKSVHATFNGKMMQTIAQVGCLKLLNEIESLELNFKPAFQDLIDFQTFSIDFEIYVFRVLAKSTNILLDKNSVLAKVNALILGGTDLLQLTNGHDLLNTIAKYFREIEARNSVTGEILASSIRMMFDRSAFHQTNLYLSLCVWQSANSTKLF